MLRFVSKQSIKDTVKLRQEQGIGKMNYEPKPDGIFVRDALCFDSKCVRRKVLDQRF